MSADTTKYTLGRGELLFTAFEAGTLTPTNGERYLGNSPSVSVSRQQSIIDHFDSDDGISELDASGTLNDKMIISFSLDEISAENMALWYLGEVERRIQPSVSDRLDTFRVKLGEHYQLSSPYTIEGASYVTSVLVSKVGSPPVVVAAAGNYVLDAVAGRLFLLPDAADINDGDQIVVLFNISSALKERITSGLEPLVGSLRFISDNAQGPNRVKFWKYVILRPEGDVQMKGDDWQTLSFTATVVKKAGAIRFVAATLPPSPTDYPASSGYGINYGNDYGGA